MALCYLEDEGFRSDSDVMMQLIQAINLQYLISVDAVNLNLESNQQLLTVLFIFIMRLYF